MTPVQKTGPDFIVIGAMKCGTSTLAAQLGAQRGIFMSDPKEPNYFSDDAIFAKGPDWYQDLFRAALPGDLKGEASTHYTKLPDLPGTIPRMQAAGLFPKFIYMIRNPVDRAVSHYIHEWSQGVIKGSIEEALQTHSALVEYGLFGMQITPYVESFGADRILLTGLEVLKSDPGRELARIGQFLEMSEVPSWSDTLGQENISANRVRRFPMHELLVDNQVATFLRRRLVPKRLRNKIRQSRQMTDRPKIPEELLPQLEARFAKDAAELSALFPNSAAIAAAYPFVQT